MRKSYGSGGEFGLLGCWLLWLLIVLGFWGTVIYVAGHFVMKYW